MSTKQTELATAAGSAAPRSPPRYAFIVAVRSQSCSTTISTTIATMPERIGTFWDRVESSPAVHDCALRDTDGEDLIAADFELHFGQRPARRAGDRPAGDEVEVAGVAGAVEATLLHLRDDRTGEMGAALVERHELALAQADQELRLARARKVELQGRANWQLRETGNGELARADPLAEIALGENPGLTGDEGEAGESEELGELAPRDVLILGNVDGKVPAPLRLLLHRPAVRRNRELVRVTTARSEVSSK